MSTRYRTVSGHWFHATPLTLGEIVEAQAKQGAAALVATFELLDRHCMFSQSDFDILSARNLGVDDALEVLEALMGVRKETPMQDDHGEQMRVSRDLHIERDGQCIAATVVALDEANSIFEVRYLWPSEVAGKDTQFRGTWGKFAINAPEWHWPRACTAGVTGP